MRTEITERKDRSRTGLHPVRSPALLRLDRLVAWLIVGMGALHLGVTPLRYPRINASAMWFASAGLALIFLGAFNLLRNRYAIVAPGLRGVCVAANLSFGLFCVAMLVVTGASTLRPHEFFLLALVFAATLFSLAPVARLWSIRDEIRNPAR